MSSDPRPAKVGDPSGSDALCWLTPEEFIQLAISTRKLLRADLPHQEASGLWDPAAGCHFVVLREQLRAFREI